MEYYELYHHGTKGMKWGIRRYQNKDGSLTPAGKKRRAKEEAKLKEREKAIKRQEKNNAQRAKIDAKKAELDAREKALKKGSKGETSDQTPKNKSVSEMSDKELQAHTNRMQLEANYYNAQRNLANATPQQLTGTKQTSRGKELAQKFFKDNVLPAVGNATKTALEGYLKKQLGLESKDEVAELKRAFDILDYKQKIDKIKNPDKYLSWDDKKKKREYDDETAKREKAAEDAKKAMDDYNEFHKNRDGSESYVDPRGNLHNKTGGEKTFTSFGGMTTGSSSSNNNNKSEPKTVYGTVEGVGNSSKKNSNTSSSSQKAAKEWVIDAEPYEVALSNVSDKTRDRGYTYIAGLLEEPKGLRRR